MSIADSPYAKTSASEQEIRQGFMVTAFPNASFLVGNLVFKGICGVLQNFYLVRIVNSTDIVPQVSFVPRFYFHVGQE
ncbi:hypothetical protein V6N13_132467 [Hibiscus sabdariffa]